MRPSLHVRWRAGATGWRARHTSVRRRWPRWWRALALLPAAVALHAQPLSEADFVRMAGQRDPGLGLVLYESSDVLITSTDLAEGNAVCASQPLEIRGHSEATRALVRRLQPAAGPAPDTARVPVERVPDPAEVQRQREARAAWDAAFKQIKPVYDREWEAAHQAHRRAMAAARTPAERKELERAWHSAWDAMRQRHFGALGPQPVVEQPPAPPVAAAAPAADPRLVLPAVRLTLLRIGLGLHDPLVPAGEAAGQDWRDVPALRGWLARVTPKVEAACPQLEHLVIAVGPYEVIGHQTGRPGPMLPQQIHVLRIDGRWRAEVRYPDAAVTMAGLLRTARPAARGNEPQAGPVLYWLEQPGHDYAFGRFFEARPAAWAALPGIEWRDRQHWVRFEDEDRRMLIERGVGGEDMRRFDAARVVFAGAFEVLPQIALWDTYVSLLGAYEQTCAAELSRLDPVVRTVTITETDPRTGVSRSTVSRRTLPRRHVDAFEEANTKYNNAMMRGGLGAVLSGGVGAILGAEQARLDRRDQRTRAAQRFLQHEGCASPASRQLMENFLRAVLRQPSMQHERAGAQR